jgi:hypothetical protein
MRKLSLTLYSAISFAILCAAAQAQIQYTITCPPGSGDWDVLSVSVLDPGLSANYHLEGSLNGTQTAYMFTTWNQSADKVYYVKNPQGYPWDINLYDGNYIYQWITENVWTDPYTYKKFNNGMSGSTSDYSMRWAPRCGAPGSWSIWNPPTSNVQNNTRFEIHPTDTASHPNQFVECGMPDTVTNLGYTLLELKPVSSFTIQDYRTNPPTPDAIQDLPLQYTWGCSSQDVNSCSDRELFDYGVDSGTNPVDNIKHSYGWIQWRHYSNTNYETGKSANWSETQYSTHYELKPNSPSNEGTPAFPCF